MVERTSSDEKFLVAEGEKLTCINEYLLEVYDKATVGEVLAIMGQMNSSSSSVLSYALIDLF